MDLRQKTCQLFQSIDKLFHHNNTLEVAREDPILLNKIAKGDIKWGRQKTVFEWDINTFNQVFTLPQVRRENIYSRLEPPPPKKPEHPNRNGSSSFSSCAALYLQFL